jgi:hypothetical protein
MMPDRAPVDRTVTRKRVIHRFRRLAQIQECSELKQRLTMDELTGRLKTGTSHRNNQSSRDNCAIFLSEILLSEILSYDPRMAWQAHG